MYNEKIIDVVTGEETIKPVSQEMLKEIEINKKLIEERLEMEKIRENLRSKAVSKLIDLGLTEEEVKAFLG